LLSGFFVATIANTEGVFKILTYSDRGPIGPNALKDLIMKSLDADKAENISCIPLKDGSALADYMIVASGTSSRHVSALATKLQERLNARGCHGLRMEGLFQSDWVILDAGDIIVHIFRPEVREFYNLEKMWSMHPVLDVVSEKIQA
jgi:ribosome-associated protein